MEKQQIWAWCGSICYNSSTQERELGSQKLKDTQVYSKLDTNLSYTRPFSKIKNKTKAINDTKREEGNKIVLTDHVSKILNTEHEVI